MKTTILHILAKAGIAVLALGLDVTGHLSHGAWQVAMMAIAGLGLTGAVAAFRNSKQSAIETALAEAATTWIRNELDKRFEAPKQ